MNQIDEKTGRPHRNYTNEEWQKDFIKIKEKVRSSKLNFIPVIKEFDNTNYTYHGKTQYQYYCDFINNTLKEIRNGETSYCFYVYQIAELLKYEHERLCSIWSEEDRCFYISLKDKTEQV